MSDDTAAAAIAREVPSPLRAIANGVTITISLLSLSTIPEAYRWQVKPLRNRIGLQAGQFETAIFQPD
jgi:hypothetical protein